MQCSHEQALNGAPMIWSEWCVNDVGKSRWRGELWTASAHKPPRQPTAPPAGRQRLCWVIKMIDVIPLCPSPHRVSLFILKTLYSDCKEGLVAMRLCQSGTHTVQLPLPRLDQPTMRGEAARYAFPGIDALASETLITMEYTKTKTATWPHYPLQSAVWNAKQFAFQRQMQQPRKTFGGLGQARCHLADHPKLTQLLQMLRGPGIQQKRWLISDIFV